jgi:lysophospholipase L1-like esterase
VQAPLRYLALGDSFTLGVGASDAHHNFPTALSRKLAAATGRLVRLSNAAVDGFTTDDLIRDKLDQLASVVPDYVTILIGGNDVWRGRTRSEYQGSLAWIYDTIAARGLPPQRVAAVSIPDWSAAPGAARYGHADQLRLVIDGYNALASNEAASRGFVWVDIAELSRSRVGEAGWLAPDQLHPADAQYAAWAEHIWDGVREAWTAT